MIVMKFGGTSVEDARAIERVAAIVKGRLPELQRAGELVGTGVSATFLLLVAAINLIVLIDIFRAFRGARQGEAYDDRGVDAELMLGFGQPRFILLGGRLALRRR